MSDADWHVTVTMDFVDWYEIPYSVYVKHAPGFAGVNCTYLRPISKSAIDRVLEEQKAAAEQEREDRKHAYKWGDPWIAKPHKVA